MTKVEIAELELRRAQDRYKAELEVASKAMEQQGDTPDARQEPAPIQEGQRLIDISKVSCLEDIVALCQALGFRVVVDVSNPIYETIEHLVADDAD